MITLSLDWGWGEKGKTEKWAPLSSRKLPFAFLPYGYPRILNIYEKKWSVDRRPGPISP
jgi:hypothetical protein